MANVRFLRRSLCLGIGIGLALVTWLPTAFASGWWESGSSCGVRFEKVWENFHGKRLEITQVSGVDKRRIDIPKGPGAPKRSSVVPGREVALEEILGRRDVVALGFTPEHVYLYSGGARHHGKMSYFTNEGFRDIRRNTQFVKDGTLMVFPDLPPETVEALRQQLIAKAGQTRPTVSCATSAYAELREGTGIHFADCGLRLPAEIVRKAFAEGFVDRNGAPVRVELYRTDSTSIEFMHENFRFMQRRIVDGAYVGFAAGGTVIVLVSAAVVASIRGAEGLKAKAATAP